MQNVLLVGFAVPDKVAEEIFKLDPLPAVQTHKFAWSLTRAIRSGFGDLLLLSACPVQNFPIVKRILFYPGSFVEHGVKGRFLPFVNVAGLKHFTRLFSVFIVGVRLVLKRRVEAVFVHGVHSPFLVFGACMRVLGTKVVVVLTDPPGQLLPTDSFFSRNLKKLDRLVVRFLLNSSSGVVALAPELVRRLAVDKPALIFPGILDASFFEKVDSFSERPVSHGKFIITYAGTLAKEYGVSALIDAISLLPDDKVQLRLFGRGDQVERIRRLSEKSSKFHYGGFVTGDDLIKELMAADLLINPRPTSNDFSVMSFPSKLIEYLATGRPVMTTRIKSIPKEYDDCFYYVDDESPDGIASAIGRVLEIDVGIREKKAHRARCFVRDSASDSAIGNLLYHFVSNL